MHQNRYSATAVILALVAVALLAGCQDSRAHRQFDLAQKLHSQGAYLEAIRNWETILASWPKSASADLALHRIGRTYYVELDQPDRSLDAFARLVKNYPQSAYAPQDQVLITQIYRSQRQYAKALAEYYRFLQMFPDDPKTAELWHDMVTCLFEVGEYQAMRTQAQGLIKKFPDSLYARDCVFWTGESYYLDKNYEKAIAKFKEYLDKYPDGPMAYKSWLSMARAVEEDDRLEEAIKLYQELLQRFPNDRIIQSRLAAAQRRYQNRFGSTK